MSELSLSTLLQQPGGVGVSLQAPVFLLLVVVGLLMLRSSRRGLERLAGALRAAALTFLALGLGGLALTTTSPAPTERSTVIAAVDLSESMNAAAQDWSLDFVNQMAAALNPGDEFGVVTFAGDTRVARAPSEPKPLEEFPPLAVRTATDIGRGLEAALALVPTETTARVLLISDGNETRGSARAKLPRARRANTVIYTAAPPPGDALDVSVEKITVPTLVTQGSVFPVRVVTRNPQGARSVDLLLSLDGEIAGEESIDLQPGLNALDIPYRLTGRGSHRLQVRIEAADDALPGNDYREGTVMVAGPPWVLLVSSRRRSPLAAALARKDIEVDRVAPKAMPTEAEDLLDYHAVVVENARAGDVPPAALAAVERYVREFAGGFVLAGGKRSFGDARFRQGPLERLLPVTLERQRPSPKPPRRKPPPSKDRNQLALMILVDRSKSMRHATVIEEGSFAPSTKPEDSKLHYAKKAALAVIRQLSDEDAVGVVAFDSQALPISPLQPVKQHRARLEKLIPQLAVGGGTDFYQALELARDQLTASPLARRHIILITDGVTNRPASEHDALISELSAASISVTSIHVGQEHIWLRVSPTHRVKLTLGSSAGREPENLSLLEDMSSETGGSFYHVDDAQTLPQLALRDASQALSSPTPRPESTEQRIIRPQVGKASQLLRGIEGQFPPLAAYAVAKSKPRADTPLYVSGGTGEEPILASWQYGLGRVVAFTADPATDAAGWVGWPAYSKFWSQIVRWVMREQTPWDYAFDVRRRDGELTLVVRAFGAEQDGVLFARLHRDEEETEELTLAPVGPQVYEAELPELEGGRYAVTVLRRVGERDVNERTEMVSVPGEDEEPQEEFQTIRPNTSLLEQVALETGGKFNPSAEEVVVREVEGSEGGVRRRYELDFLLIPLAMACFLADVAVRRIWIIRDTDNK